MRVVKAIQEGSDTPAGEDTGIVDAQARAALQQLYQAVRQCSRRIAAPLSAEDCCVQSMPDASPVKWHLAHTSWFFETFVLERYEVGFKAFHPDFRVLFNSYYNGVGEKYPRARRGMLTRPSLEEVHSYRRNVDARILALLDHNADAEACRLIRLGLHHEQQHQELIYTDIKHLLAQNPTHPAYIEPGLAEAPAMLSIARYGWQQFEGGQTEIGAGKDGEFCFDNETPRHTVWLQPFQIASRLVTNGEYMQFIAAGAYENPGLWLSEGWDWVVREGRTHPLYWHPGENVTWHEFTLHGLVPLVQDAALTHVSYFEADAFARWSGARLPTEAEWEHAAATRGESLLQLYDTAWQWTQSSYAPYPGFAPAAGVVGEYNGKFMVNQYVLRGGSAATPAGHTRPTYRNFFPAHACWQFSGIRLAHDLPPSSSRMTRHRNCMGLP